MEKHPHRGSSSRGIEGEAVEGVWDQITWGGWPPDGVGT